MNRKGKMVANYINFKISLSKGLASRYYSSFEIVGKYGNGCDYLIKNTSQLKTEIKRIQVNNLKTFFERDQPKPSSKLCRVQEFNSSIKGYNKIVTDPKNKVLTKTIKQFKIDMVIVPDATNSRS